MYCVIFTVRLYTPLRLAACKFPASAKWVLTTMCEIRETNYIHN